MSEEHDPDCPCQGPLYLEAIQMLRLACEDPDNTHEIILYFLKHHASEVDPDSKVDCGPFVMLMQVWIFAFVTMNNLPVNEGDHGYGFQVENGNIDDPDLACTAWALRLVAARLNNDVDYFFTLIDSLLQPQKEVATENILDFLGGVESVLRVIANLINHAQHADRTNVSVAPDFIQQLEDLANQER